MTEYSILNLVYPTALFGGTGGRWPAHDIEVRRNHFFKPMLWNPAHPAYANKRWTTKNHFECKNCDRVLLEGNVMENVWGGFSQQGMIVSLICNISFT